MNFKKSVEESYIGLLLFLIILPLSTGISIASGAPISAGIIASIIGLLITILAKNNFLIYGPNAALALIVFSAISKFPNYDTFLLSVIFSGIVQIVLGISKSATAFNLIPKTVIKGVVISIIILLLIKQMPHLLGFNYETKSIKYGYLLTSIPLIIIILFGNYFHKKFSQFHILLFLVSLSIFSLFLVDLLLSNFSISDNLKINLNEIDLFATTLLKSSFQSIAYLDILINGLTLAIISSLDSIICAKAIEDINENKIKIDVNRVLIIQGLGNIISGFFGGIPITISFVRSSLLNIYKVNTKIAFVLSLLLLLLGVTVFPNLISKIPLIIPTVILIYIGYNLLIVKKNYKSIFAENYKAGIVLYTTILCVIRFSLTIGVLAGILSTLLILILDYINLRKQKIKITLLFLIHQYKKIWIVLISGLLTVLISLSNFFEFERNLINNLQIFGTIFGVLAFLLWESNKRK